MRVNRCQFAGKDRPLNAEKAAPVAKAASLVFTRSMPMACATSSSSRTAIQLRPSREYLRACGYKDRDEDSGQDHVEQYLLVGKPSIGGLDCPGNACDAVGAAEPRLEPVRQEDQADDLAEAQGDNRQVVTADLQDGDAQDHAGERAHQHRKRQRLPPGQVYAQPLDLR